MLHPLDDKTLVSGQITPDQMAGIKAAGVTMIVNNRPDGEDADQPLAADIEAAAERAGIDYRAVPIARGIGPADVAAMGAALEDADGKVLAFCRSGTRSALAWALARRQQGASVEEIEEAVAGAGVSLDPIRHLL